MIVFRNTGEIAKELGLRKPDITETEDEGYFGSWFCNVVTVNRRKCLIFCHATTLYSFFVPCVTKKEFANFFEVFQINLSANLEYEGINPTVIRNLLCHYQEVVLSKTNNRSVLGSMNDYCYLFGAYVEPGGPQDCDILAVNQKINTAPMSALKYSSGVKEMKRMLMRVAI